MSEDPKLYETLSYETPNIKIRSMADLIDELDHLAERIKQETDAMRTAVEKVRFLEEQRKRREREYAATAERVEELDGAVTKLRAADKINEVL